MPKPTRNAFYYYMQDFKEEQRKKGVNLGNMKEVAEAAGPSWVSAHPSVRAKYEARMKAEKQKYNIPDKKYTSTGVSLAEIDRIEQERQEAEQAERSDITNLVRLKTVNKSIFAEDIYLIDVNIYGKANGEYIIGESTILRFSLLEGIKDNYHELIYPDSIPVGYAHEVKLGCVEFGLEYPDDPSKRSNYIQILANVVDYLKQTDRKMKTLPPLFTMPDKVLPVVNFVQQMCRRAEEDDGLFRVYKLDTLYFTLLNAIKNRNNEGFPKESLALTELKKDAFKYTPGLGCEHHEENEKTTECTLSRTSRWAYTIMDRCCPVGGVEALPGKHMPPEYDMEGIYTYKEQKRSRATTVEDGAWGAGSSCNTTADLDLSTVVNSSIDSKKKERTHQPLRMPMNNYSDQIRQAPELTEENFPTLIAGSGRGRGLSSSLNKMNIRK